MSISIQFLPNSISIFDAWWYLLFLGNIGWWCVGWWGWIGWHGFWHDNICNLQLYHGWTILKYLRSCFCQLINLDLLMNYLKYRTGYKSLFRTFPFSLKVYFLDWFSAEYYLSNFQLFQIMALLSFLISYFKLLVSVVIKVSYATYVANSLSSLFWRISSASKSCIALFIFFIILFFSIIRSVFLLCYISFCLYYWQSLMLLSVFIGSSLYYLSLYDYAIMSYRLSS